MEEKKEESFPVDSWKFRRLFMLWQMLFCKIVIGFVLVMDKTGGVAETAVDFSFCLMGVIILAYVFGATWDDMNKMNFIKRK